MCVCLYVYVYVCVCACVRVCECVRVRVCNRLWCSHVDHLWLSHFLAEQFTNTHTPPTTDSDAFSQYIAQINVFFKYNNCSLVHIIMVDIC